MSKVATAHNVLRCPRVYKVTVISDAGLHAPRLYAYLHVPRCFVRSQSHLLFLG